MADNYVAEEQKDCKGIDVWGRENGVFWVGTPNAWFIIGDDDTSGCDETGKPDGSCDGPDVEPATPIYFQMEGRIDNNKTKIYVVASSYERACQRIPFYGLQLECRVIRQFPLKMKVTVEQMQAGFLFLTDEEIKKVSE